MSKPIIFEMSPIAFGLESDLANTGITRACRELIVALDHSLQLTNSSSQFYVYSEASRWHNCLLHKYLNTELELRSIIPLIDPCDVSIASKIYSGSRSGGSVPRDSLKHHTNTLENLGDVAFELIDNNKYVYVTSYLPTPLRVRENNNVQVVHQINDLFPLTKPSLFHGGIDAVWQQKSADFYANDHYICISESTASELAISFPYIPQENIHVVHLAGDHAVRSLSCDVPRTRRLYRLEDKPYFITVSTLEPRKNLPFLLKAFGEFKRSHGSNFRLVCIGAEGWLSHSEKLLIDSMSNDGDIRFLGRLEDSDTFDLISEAAGYVSASKAEGFGLGLAEAMSLGCLPIAASNTSQIEVIKDIGLLFTTFDELVQAFSAATSNTHTAASIRSRSLERFSWRKSAELTRNIIEQLASS